MVIYYNIEGDNMEVPRYGIHNGIKYSPRRTLIRWCIICGNPFIPKGRRDKVCSDECRVQLKKNNNNRLNPIHNPMNNFKNNKKYNDKWNPINNTKKLEDPEARRKHYQSWLDWYRNMHPDQRKKYNDKKKMTSKKNKKTQVEDYQALQEEMKALGLR